MITIRDIHKRLKLLPESTSVGKSYFSYLEKAENAIQSGNPDKIMKMIETGVNDSSNSILLETILDLYDALYECGNEHNVQVYGDIIAEKYVAKVRDAKETQTNLRRKIGRIKTAATTKVTSNVAEIEENIKKAIDALKGNFSSNVGQIKSNVQNGLPQKKPKPSKAKNEAFINSYEKMLETSTKMIYCDRILDNYNRVSKRFNIDRIIQENVLANGIDDTIVYICRLLETYDVPDKVKYNTALETVWYGFNKNYVDCSPSVYTTLITDYFMAKGNNRDMCGTLLEASMIVKTDDYDGDLEVITEEEPEEDEEELVPKFESMAVQDQIRAYATGYPANTIFLKEEVADFNKIFNDYKKSDDKNKETKLQWLVRKLYAKNPNDVVNGTPNLFKYIRLVFVLGTVLINPIIAGVAAIADVFIALHAQRKTTEQMLTCFKNEIAVSKKKLKTVTNPNEKARLKKYIDELEKGYEKINEYYEDKLTDAEIDKKYDEESESEDSFGDMLDDFEDEDGEETSKKNSGKDDDFDDDDDDDFGLDDLDFNEAFIYTTGVLAEKYDAIPHKEITKEMMEEMVRTAPGVSNELADISLRYPNIIDPDVLKEVVETELHECKANNGSLNALSALSEAKSKLEYNPVMGVKESTSLTGCASQLKDTISILESLNEILQSCHYYHPLIEGSFTNSIKLASEKVKKTLTKLTDKERQVSQSIDVAANNSKKAMEKALTNDNREAVIKGSVLPSASKCIKLGITTAGLGLINPVLAVIGALGYLGTSKHYREKERQLVIDEIETELKMCEKYIEIAESKNDMKALKKLLTIQKELERQRQRLRYNMKMKLGQKYFDPKAAPATISND